MENFDFGLTMVVVGMGSTLIILFIISLIIEALNKIFLSGSLKKEGEK